MTEIDPTLILIEQPSKKPYLSYVKIIFTDMIRLNFIIKKIT